MSGVSQTESGKGEQEPGGKWARRRALPGPSVTQRSWPVSPEAKKTWEGVATTGYPEASPRRTVPSGVPSVLHRPKSLTPGPARKKSRSPRTTKLWAPPKERPPAPFSTPVPAGVPSLRQRPHCRLSGQWSKKKNEPLGGAWMVPTGPPVKGKVPAGVPSERRRYDGAKPGNTCRRARPCHTASGRVPWQGAGQSGEEIAPVPGAVPSVLHRMPSSPVRGSAVENSALFPSERKPVGGRGTVNRGEPGAVLKSPRR